MKATFIFYNDATKIVWGCKKISKNPLSKFIQMLKWIKFLTVKYHNCDHTKEKWHRGRSWLLSAELDPDLSTEKAVTHFYLVNG